jgi:Na+-transporting NADH:ubiquinone oxidoreductase subunit C
MMKGEHGGEQSSIDYFKDEPHKVDGMSGATLTGKGLNAMLKTYLESYQNFFKKVKEKSSSTALVE